MHVIRELAGNAMVFQTAGLYNFALLCYNVDSEREGWHAAKGYKDGRAKPPRAA